MRALIDGDILLHEMGWSGEFKDKETGEPILLDFDELSEIIDDRIRVINVEIEATEEPLIFLSDSEWLTAQINKERKFAGEPEREFIPNFRYNVAKTKPYKGTRKNPKPFHFYNILAYLRGKYDTIVSSGGLEADDELGIFQCSREVSDTTICSRDKDLRMVPGNHYSWECGKQRSVGPVHTDELGWLEKTDSGKTIGYGRLFFYYQLLVGDAVDNIPGLPGCGAVAANRILEGTESIEDGFERVKQAYRDKIGEGAKDYFLEQAQLLWIMQDREKGYQLP